MAETSTAIVTGAARGIGLAIATRLLRDGFGVIMADLDGEKARREAEALRLSGAESRAVQVDVTQPDSVDAMVAAALDRWGRLDVLVNNAGVAGRSAEVKDLTLHDWQQVIDVDLTGVFLCCRAAVRAMLPRGSGRIVNIASIAGKEGNPGLGPYSAAKAGVIGLTKSLGKELATSGILVNAVAPAVIETEILRQLSEETVQYMVSKIPMARTGRPEEVANLVAWLSSPSCSFSTGAVYDISGGRATY